MQRHSSIARTRPCTAPKDMGWAASCFTRSAPRLQASRPSSAWIGLLSQQHRSRSILPSYPRLSASRIAIRPSKAVSLYSDAIADHLRDDSETHIDVWMAVVPEEVSKYCRPKSKVGRAEAQRSDVLMNKSAATRLLRDPGLFEDDNRSAEIYLYELDFHNQLKARLLVHKAAVQVVRETTLAPEEFFKSNGMPLRALQDPATLAWNLATTCYFKAGGKPWQLANVRPGVCYVGVVFKEDAPSAEPGICRTRRPAD